MSDIFVKTAGLGSTGWKKATNLFVKTSGLGNTGWKAAVGVWIRNATQWIKVWPLSGVFATRRPWIGNNSDSLYADRLQDSGIIRIGSNYYGNNAQWDPNGWIISSYTYQWRYYDGQSSSIYIEPTEIIDSGTGSGWTSGGTGQDLLPTTIWTSTNSTNMDRKYLAFRVVANASNSTYSGLSESERPYIIRRVPQYTGSPSLSTNSPQVGTSITYTAPTWDTTEARKAESYRTTIYWYTNSTSTTTGGTYVGNGSSYTPVSGDLGKYIYAVETRYNSGTDYDLGASIGVEAKVVTTSAVSAGLTPPTSVSVSSVSRYSNTQTLVTLSHSGGSGPYYQMYWVASQDLPTTANYDAASNTSSSSISEAFSFAHNTTYYFYVRSSSENIATTFTNGTATNGTYSSYSDITPRPFYTFQQPSGSVSVSPSSGTAGTTQFTASASVSAAPTATVSYEWQFNEGGAIGWVAISGATSSSYTPPSNYVSLYGSELRCQITANNGVGTQLVTQSATVTVNAALTKLSTPTNVNATDTRTDGVNVTWTAVSGAAYYGVWYGPAPSYDSLADFGGNRNTTLITGTSYLDTSIGAGVTRDYYVQAYRSGDPTGTKSEWGGPNSGTRLEVVNPPTNATIPTLSPTSIAVGTQLTAGVGTWNNNPTGYDLRIYRGTAGVLTSETLVASTTSSTTLNYTVTQTDYNSGQRYFRTYVNASNTGGSSGFVAGQERGPIATPVTQYTISWNANGGTVSPASNTVNSGTSVTAPTPTRSGYTFLYWRDSPNAFSYVYQINPGGSWTVTSDITFYAYWQAAASAPATPTGVGLSGSGSVSWTASTGATSYEIEFYTAQSSTGASAAGPYSVTGISSSPYQLISPYASPNNWARVRVRARNSAGASAYSAWVPSSTTYT
jgi:hypothetical protein